jgi:hypothetical protein
VDDLDTYIALLRKPKGRGQSGRRRWRRDRQGARVRGRAWRRRNAVAGCGSADGRAHADTRPHLQMGRLVQRLATELM